MCGKVSISIPKEKKTSIETAIKAAIDFAYVDIKDEIPEDWKFCEKVRNTYVSDVLEIKLHSYTKSGSIRNDDVF